MGAELPYEYVDFLLCCRLHCLPKDLDEMDQESYAQLVAFMQAEGEAGKLRKFQSQHYGK